jgi:hypothetical protein
MKKLFILICLLISLAASAQEQIMLPTIPFNEAKAKQQLSRGKSIIKGVAYIEGRALLTNKKTEKTLYVRSGQLVSLYPVTDYLLAYLELSKRNKEGVRIAAISPLANAYKIEYKVITDTGDFLFINLKPGKYYIVSNVHYAGGVGAVEVSDIVEIKNDGETINLELKKINKGWGYGGIGGRLKNGVRNR